MIEKYGQVIITEDDIKVENFTFDVPIKEARFEALIFARHKIEDAIRKFKFEALSEN